MNRDDRASARGPGARYLPAALRRAPRTGDRPRRHRRRLRAERPRRGDHAGRGRPLGAGAARRRRRSAAACRSAELTLPGLRPRRLLGDPPARRRLALLPVAAAGRARASSWSTRRRPLAHPLDDGTAVVLERSVAATAARLGPDGGRVPRGSSGRSSRDAEPLSRGVLGRRCGRRATRSPLARFAPRGLRSAVGLRAALRGRAGARAAGGHGRPLVPAARRARSRGAFGARARPCSATRSAGRSSAGGVAAGSPTRWPPTCARSAARSRPAGAVASLDELPPAARRAARRHAARSSLAIAGARLPPRYRRRLGRLPLRAGRLQGRLGARRARSPGGRRTARGRRRSTSAARWPRSPPPRRAVAAGGHPERPVRPARPADPRRPEPRARPGRHTAWALLPRPARLAGRHDRAHRAPGRALRARASAT